MSHYRDLKKAVDDLRSWTYGEEYSVRKIAQAGGINNSTLSMAKRHYGDWPITLKVVLGLAKARDKLEAKERRIAMKERLKQRREERE